MTLVNGFFCFEISIDNLEHSLFRLLRTPLNKAMLNVSVDVQCIHL